jgi:hypothetical protein
VLKSGLFDSTAFTVNGDGFPVGNRAIDSETWRKFIGSFAPNGVPLSPSDNLEVTAAGGMDVSVAEGIFAKKGAFGWLDAAKTITLTTSTSDQVIYIGARLAALDAQFVDDDIAAYTTFVTETDTAFARITIPANATAITSGMIDDLRGNRAYCGYATDLRAQAEEAIAAIETTGIIPHVTSHEYGGADELSAASIGQYGVASLNSDSVIDAAESAVVINAQTDNYTAALSDLGKDIWITSSSNKTLTIPLQSSVAWVDKSYFFLTRGGTGTLTIAGASGVTVNSAGSRLKVAEQYGTVMVRRTAENVWLVTGSTSA